MATVTMAPAATLDCRGLSCPMAIVKARKAMAGLAVGDVLEVLTTDKGAPLDFRNWAEQTENRFLGVEEAPDHFRIRIKKLVPDVKEKGPRFPHEVNPADLARRLEVGDKVTVLDVREKDEYLEGHIPGAIHVPLGDLEHCAGELDPQVEYAVVCRSGRRSDLACQILDRKGFKKLANVASGMMGWRGPVEH